MLGKPVAWVNNEFRQHVFDVSDIVSASHSKDDTNLTVVFESAHTYGVNVSTLPQVEPFPAGVLQVVSSIGYFLYTNALANLNFSSNIPMVTRTSARLRLTLDGIGFVLLRSIHRKF